MAVAVTVTMDAIAAGTCNDGGVEDCLADRPTKGLRNRLVLLMVAIATFYVWIG